MKYDNGRTPATATPPPSPWKCKHCTHQSGTLGEAFVHVKDVHGIDPLAPIQSPPSQQQQRGAA